MIAIRWDGEEGQGTRIREVWRWNGEGWNEPVPQPDRNARQSGAAEVLLPVQPGWYLVRYSRETASDEDSSGARRMPRVSGLHPAPFRTGEGTRWGYIDDHGRTAVEPVFEYAEPFQENGLAIVQQDGRSGLLDANGRLRVKAVFEVLLPFSEGRAVASDQKGYLLINENGREITGSRRYPFLNTLENGRALFGTASSGGMLYGYLDKEGREAIPARYPEAEDFRQGRALVKLPDGSYALINPDGQILHAYNYVFVGSPGDGLLPFQLEENGRYGYISEEGDEVIAPRFTSALPFSEGRAVVNTAPDYGSAFGLIDRSGSFITEPKYADVQQLGEGVVALGTPVSQQEPYRGTRYKLASAEDGRILHPGPLQSVSRYTEGYASVSDGAQTYWVDPSGRRAAFLPAVEGNGMMTFSGKLVRADVNLRTSYYERSGRQVWQENKLIPLKPPYAVAEQLFHPGPEILVYYPKVRGISDEKASEEVNRRLRELSIPRDSPGEPGQGDSSYTGDFDVVYFHKNLLVLELNGYRMPYGAAHGMPTRIYTPLNLRTGRFYTLSDLFKPEAPYTRRLGEIVGRQIANDPQYSYVFPDSYKGIAPDQPFYVDSGALYLVFAPYEIAPYAAGFPVFRIPFAEIMGLISTEGDFWQSFH
ncbi:DUF3298 domain-containing protein [Paenibacillus spiritus]|uniref:DUF3298 domain-containing protein n=1 Tax=Paenibacillus spiritus TaxID=2496557 RepID=A0A5J5GDN4_9BACL|nr:WG repeat-containing protein [Paenibacillus spiritus]KAA9006306.1 DUF3298 domain-containing protein [Paenibacillus spiritus]